MPAPAAPSEKFTQENDYTLSVEQRRDSNPDAGDTTLKAVSSITRSFNFQSQQVTTTTREYVYQLPKCVGGAAGYTSGSSGVAVASFIQNFEDIQSPAEIARIHARLVAFGGHPPPLDELRIGGEKTLLKGPKTLKGTGG